MTMLVVSHELRFARDAADRIVFMDQGQIVEEGAAGGDLRLAPREDRTRAFVAELRSRVNARATAWAGCARCRRARFFTSAEHDRLGALRRASSSRRAGDTADILKGMLVTVEIAAAVVATGLALGLALASLRAYRLSAVNALIVVFVDVFRALPPLVAILLIYFGFPSIGINLPSFVVLWLVLSFVLAAFAEEIFWAGITSTPKGQWEAARSTGLSFSQTLAYVVMPQAVRLGVPPLTNRTIAITKNTALGTVIGVGEILNQATTAQSFTGNATPLMMGAIAYIVLFVPVVALGRWIETRFAWRRA